MGCKSAEQHRVNRDCDLSQASVPRVNLSKPISIKHYSEEKKIPLPGFTRRSNALHIPVGQGQAETSYDIPLVSFGFGPCWAAIIYDRNTARSIMLHVDDTCVKCLQRSKIERILGLPNKGQREAIIVRSNYRTHAYEGSGDYFKSIGCTHVRTIDADSRGYHWSISYLPNKNEFAVITTTKKQVTCKTYRGFSSHAYDPELRATQLLEERHFELARRSLEFCKWQDQSWGKLNGHFTPAQFKALYDTALQCYPNLGAIDSLRGLLIQHGYAFQSDKSLVIPSLLHWLDSDLSKPYYNMVKGTPYATIRIHNNEDFKELQTRIAHAFNGPLTKHLDVNFLLLSSPTGEGEVILHFGFGEIVIHELRSGDFLRQVINTLSDVVGYNKYRLTYSGLLGSSDNAIPSYDLASWAQLNEYRERMRPYL